MQKAHAVASSPEKASTRESKQPGNACRIEVFSSDRHCIGTGRQYGDPQQQKSRFSVGVSLHTPPHGVSCRSECKQEEATGGGGQGGDRWRKRRSTTPVSEERGKKNTRLGYDRCFAPNPATSGTSPPLPRKCSESSTVDARERR